jgi:hypothetical protein
VEHATVLPRRPGALAGLVEQALEGMVAKPKTSRYIPGERGWTKIKNRGYWRYPIEREGVIPKPPASVRVKAQSLQRLRSRF